MVSAKCMYIVLRGDRNLAASISYVTYYSVIRENLVVLHKLCTSVGLVMTKLQET